MTRPIDQTNKFDVLVSHFIAIEKAVGIDVSRWQESNLAGHLAPIDWAHVRSENPWLSFAIAKINDPDWAHNATGIASAGLGLGGYWFMSPDAPIEPAIEATRAAIQDTKTRFLLLDVESNHRCSIDELASKINAFISAFADTMPTLIYTYAPYLAQFGHALDLARKAIADYRGLVAPSLDCDIYQFSGGGDFGGIKLQLVPNGPLVWVDHDVIFDDDLAFYATTVAT